jgi:hypothetical protein
VDNGALVVIDERELGPRLGAGREAEVYARDAATVLKPYRPGVGGHHAEAVALRALDGTVSRRGCSTSSSARAVPGWWWSAWPGRTS